MLKCIVLSYTVVQLLTLLVKDVCMFTPSTNREPEPSPAKVPQNGLRFKPCPHSSRYKLTVAVILWNKSHFPIHVVWTLPSAAHFGVQILPVYWDSTRAEWNRACPSDSPGELLFWWLSCSTKVTIVNALQGSHLWLEQSQMSANIIFHHCTF